MPDRRPNPFPATAVEPDDLNREEFKSRSARTWAVGELERILEGYDRGEYRGCIVGIRGDYGTGKTHLLRLAEFHFAEKNGEPPEDMEERSRNRARNSHNVLVSTNSTGSSFREYFQEQILGQLQQKEFEHLMLRFLARVAEEEAKRLSITSSVVEPLQADYRVVHEVLNSEVVPTTRIFDRAGELLAEYSGQQVLVAVFEALWDPATSPAAFRWLVKGLEAEQEDLEKLRVDQRLNTDKMAMDTVRLLVRVFSYVGLRWVVLIDQFEHLMRYEQVNQSEHIQAAFKDLSRAMDEGHCLIIAGHYDGWRVRDDFYGRFMTPLLDIPNLKVPDIRAILAAYLKVSKRAPKPHLVNALKQESRGNLRTLLLICNKMYKRLKHPESFLKAKPQTVTTAYIDIRYMRSEDEVLDMFAHRLQKREVTFESRVVVSGWHVDIVLPSCEDPQVLVNIETATESKSEIKRVRANVNRALVVRELFPHLHLILILTGYVSPELLREVQEADFERFDVLDGTDRAFARRLDALAERLPARPVSENELATGKADEATVREILERLKAIEAQRELQDQELQKRLERLKQKDARLVDDVEVQETLERGIGSAIPTSEMLLPFRRLRFVGGVPKVGVLFSLTWLAWNFLVIFSQTIQMVLYKWTPLFSLPWSLLLVLAFLGVFYLDWRVADGVTDALLARRTQDLLEDKDLYIIFKRERWTQQKLRRASRFLLFPHWRWLQDLVEDGNDDS